jgi:hypothetical protein
MHVQGQNTGTPTASCLRKWKLTGRQENPPYTLRVPGELEYLQIYAKEMAYVELTDQTESAHNIRKRIYNTLVTLTKNGEARPGYEDREVVP